MRGLLQRYEAPIATARMTEPASAPTVEIQAEERRSIRLLRRPFIVSTGTESYTRRRYRRRVSDLKTLSESALPSRAIRLIRGGVARLDHGVQPNRDVNDAERDEYRQSIDRVWSVLSHPSLEYPSLGDWVAPLIEDMLAFDAGVWENVPKPKGLSGNETMSLELVPGYSIAKNINWSGDPEQPRWAQVLEGIAQGKFPRFLDREIEYLVQRERTWSPYGLSQLETVVDIMEAYLGLSAYQREVASQAYPAFLLYLGDIGETELDTFRMYWESDIAGKGRPGIFGNTQGKPESLQTKPIGDEGLYPQYWDRLTRIVAFSFDLKPLDFGIEADVNRSTAEILAMQSIEEARRPIAELIATRINSRTIPMIANITGDERVRELEFFWIGLNPSDKKEEAEIHHSYLEDDVLKIDDVRGDLDLPPLPNGVGQMTLSAYREFMKVDLGNSLLPQPLVEQTEEAVSAFKAGRGNGRYWRRPRRTTRDGI